MKVNSMFSGSAVVCTALLAASLIFSARTLEAETLLIQLQNQAKEHLQPSLNDSVSMREGHSASGMEPESVEPPVELPFIVAPSAYVATAYSLRGRTASGRPVSKGLIAADPRLLPLGSRVRLEAGAYSGEYLVADTGGSVHGRRIDIWTPSSGEALRFGRRTIKVSVLSYGGKRRATKATGK